jgi:hypothetical protein
MKCAQIGRRELLQRGAAVTAIAAIGLPMGAAMARGEPGQLAALVSRYFAEVDAFNTRALTDASTDEEADALAEATYRTTLRQMIGTPARTPDDALAALDWLFKEDADFKNEYGGAGLFGRVVTSLVDAIKDYIVSTGRQA